MTATGLSRLGRSPPPTDVRTLTAAWTSHGPVRHRSRRQCQSSWRIRHLSATKSGTPPRKSGTYIPCRFRNCSADGESPDQDVCRIPIEMADAVFHSSWRILEPYGRPRKHLDRVPLLADVFAV